MVSGSRKTYRVLVHGSLSSPLRPTHPDHTGKTSYLPSDVVAHCLLFGRSPSPVRSFTCGFHGPPRVEWTTNASRRRNRKNRE